MQNLDVRYHSDGSIDFDFYRRRAVRQRRLTQRILARHLIRLFHGRDTSHRREACRMVTQEALACDRDGG